MKKILLIDADSKIPNLALMKLSAYYKLKKFNVYLKKLNISYYPKKNIKKIDINFNGYEKIYCSVIFSNTKRFIKNNNKIIFGGTGHSLNIKLDKKIEKMLPDYSLYPENDFSYGFISRGCIRNCFFCVVPEKEGKIKWVNPPRERGKKIVKHVMRLKNRISQDK